MAQENFVSTAVLDQMALVIKINHLQEKLLKIQDEQWAIITSLLDSLEEYREWLEHNANIKEK